jgi:DNA-binding transcriptional ArsR family regulator
MKDASEFEDCAQRLKALADPERLRIVTCLFAGAKNVGDLAAALDDEIVKVSHHLKVLRKAGLVLASKEGRFVVYQLHPDVVPNVRQKSQLQHIDIGCCRLELAADDPCCKPRAKS